MNQPVGLDPSSGFQNKMLSDEAALDTAMQGLDSKEPPGTGDDTTTVQIEPVAVHSTETDKLLGSNPGGDMTRDQNTEAFKSLSENTQCPTGSEKDVVLHIDE